MYVSVGSREEKAEPHAFDEFGFERFTRFVFLDSMGVHVLELHISECKQKTNPPQRIYPLRRRIVMQHLVNEVVHCFLHVLRINAV